MRPCGAAFGGATRTEPTRTRCRGLGVGVPGALGYAAILHNWPPIACRWDRGKRPYERDLRSIRTAQRHVTPVERRTPRGAAARGACGRRAPGASSLHGSAWTAATCGPSASPRPRSALPAPWLRSAWNGSSASWWRRCAHGQAVTLPSVVARWPTCSVGVGAAAPTTHPNLARRSVEQWTRFPGRSTSGSATSNASRAWNRAMLVFTRRSRWASPTGAWTHTTLTPEVLHPRPCGQRAGGCESEALPPALRPFCTGGGSSPLGSPPVRMVWLLRSLRNQPRDPSGPRSSGDQHHAQHPHQVEGLARFRDRP